MFVQLYSLTHADDVRVLVELGVDNLGFAIGDQDVPARIPVERARDLFDLVPDGHNTVALSVHTDPDAVVEFAHAVGPDVLHLCSPTDAIDSDTQRRIRGRIPDGMAVMKAIDVDGPEAVAAAERFAPVSDYLILDTATDEVTGVGASGETHDWSVSRTITERVEVPVVLAGGLGPDNVAEAIETVEPAGVDSYTRTSRTERRKDLEAVREFVREVREAA